MLTNQKHRKGVIGISSTCVDFKQCPLPKYHPPLAITVDETNGSFVYSYWSVVHTALQNITLSHFGVEIAPPPPTLLTPRTDVFSCISGMLDQSVRSQSHRLTTEKCPSFLTTPSPPFSVLFLRGMSNSPITHDAHVHTHSQYSRVRRQRACAHGECTLTCTRLYSYSLAGRVSVDTRRLRLKTRVGCSRGAGFQSPFCLSFCCCC